MMTNDKRADEVEAALLVFAERTGLDPDPLEGDGPVTVAGDMICQHPALGVGQARPGGRP